MLGKAYAQEVSAALYFGNVVANYLPSAKVVDVRNNYYPNG